MGNLYTNGISIWLWVIPMRSDSKRNPGMVSRKKTNLFPYPELLIPHLQCFFQSEDYSISRINSNS